LLAIKKNNDARKLVSKVFQEVNDMVVPTMGAKGLLVALDDDLGKCTLTDDGVTVARQAIHMDGMEKMIAVDMIEAAATTEREALDGTTLTILLTNELYQLGYKRILRGEHPQIVADMIEQEINLVREKLILEKMPMTEAHVKDIATISTKIPMVGQIVAQAYKHAGRGMNIVIEHDREGKDISIEHQGGFGIDSGYMSDAMRSLCEDGEKFEAKDSWIVLLKEGIMTQAGLGNFFKSIPEENIKDPFVFVMNPNFNPNTLRLLIDTLIKNQMKYQFIFINEDKADDVYMDIAAVTGGTVQDASSGVGDYLFEHCGRCDKITIEIDKTIFNCSGTNKNIKQRIKVYNKKLEKKFKLNRVDEALYTKRLGALEKGIVKIKVGVPTVTEYQTLRLKLDDAIGAVRKAFETGIVLGGGKTLYNIANDNNFLQTSRALSAALKQVCKNAGIKNIPRRQLNKNKKLGLDVTQNKIVDLEARGILDSYASIDEALKNASSIACSYLKTNCIIKKETTQNK
jgi:chaperonin GroEL